MSFRRLIRDVAVLTVFLSLASVPLEAAPSLATFELGPGWATFGLALPRGAAIGGVQVGQLPTQTDVKTTWPDGSIRFAVVTCRVPAGGRYSIGPGRRDPGGFVAAWPSAAVEFMIDGHRWTATLVSGSADTWLSGSQVSESRVIVAPNNGDAHPFLRVIFDVRSYADRTYRLDVTVENALDIEVADQVTYDVRVVIGGATVITKSRVNHKYLTRWRKVFHAGVPEAPVIPDFTPFVQSGAIPPYLTSIEAGEDSVDGSAKFDILGTGDLHIPMNDHAGRPEIAPYPDWAARYLVHKQPSQREYVLRHGELAGSFAIHIKEPDGLRLVSIDRRPNFWLDRRADDDGRPKNGLRGVGVGADIAHQPSLAYIPYLVTGDRYFLDEMKYWANYCLIGTFQDGYYNSREGSRGLLKSNEVRGVGWGLRNLGDAAAYAPDSDPDHAYFSGKVDNNLRWLDEYAARFVTPFGTVFTPHRPEDDDSPYTWIALWEQNYVAWAIDHLLTQGFTRGAQLRDRIVNFQLRLLTSEREGYARRNGAPYVLAVGRKTGQSYSFFATLADISHVTFVEQGKEAPPIAGAYGVDARLMLLIACARQQTGACDAINYLMTAPGMEDDLNRRAGWAIAFASLELQPYPPFRR